jgi:hypothetical protein
MYKALSIHDCFFRNKPEGFTMPGVETLLKIKRARNEREKKNGKMKRIEVKDDQVKAENVETIMESDEIEVEDSRAKSDGAACQFSNSAG